MIKLVRDGKVGVIIHAEYGGGWYTSHGSLELLYSPTIIDLIESGKPEDLEKISEYMLTRKSNGHSLAYFGLYGATKSLEVRWIEQGSRFRVLEYDGFESIELEHYTTWQIA